MSARDNHRLGNAMLEFVLVGIPVIFVMVSVFELARGMWLYHTAAYALKEGARFAIVRGNNCNIFPNNCVVTVRAVAARIRDSAVGLLPEDLQDVVFDSAGNTVTCPTLLDCLQPGSLGDTYWPANAPGAGDAPGAYRTSRIEIYGHFPFRSAVAMFWPGAGRGVNFGTFLLPASSKERIQY